MVFASRGSETSGIVAMYKDWVVTDFAKMGIGLKPNTDMKLKIRRVKNTKNSQKRLEGKSQSL
ncbi:hypothetical protein [Listeria aquatica]|uniref:hypothetical protein n=1 Tax=Listeria aquatica TaxID=1494960 RepID=UPI0031F54F75